MIRIRMANPPKDMLDKLPRKKRLYYKKKAMKVVTILNHRVMQSLLKELIEHENLDLDRIGDVRVMVLPSTKDREYGEHLYGLYDPKSGRISIYPAVKYKSPEFLRDPMVSFQFIMESFDTLVHEILHSKYRKESTVKSLTKTYLKRFYQMLSEYLE